MKSHDCLLRVFRTRRAFSQIKMATGHNVDHKGEGVEELLAGNLLHQGSLEEVKEAVEKLHEGVLADQLGLRSGANGYTPLHEVVSRDKAEVLDYLLTQARNIHVNCQAGNGQTPLHLAATRGYDNCVKVLLEHGANVSITDVYGRTPTQVGVSPSIIRLLRSEGKLS